MHLAGTGMLLAMLITWEVEGHPHYASMSDNQKIAYISDIGAQGLKPLFIAGCCVTTVFLDLSFAAERYLRHTGALARNTGMVEKVLSGLSILFAIAGTAGLILLSIFDTLHHPHLHDGFLVLFIAGYVISAIFICAEYQRLGVHFRQHRVLRISFWLKLIFIILEVCLAIVFGVTSDKNHTQIAAFFEWIIAFVFTFYVLTFFVDLLPAVRIKNQHKHPRDNSSTNLENGHNYTTTNTNISGGANAYYSNGQPVHHKTMANGDQVMNGREPLNHLNAYEMEHNGQARDSGYYGDNGAVGNGNANTNTNTNAIGGYRVNGVTYQAPPKPITAANF
ncbi:MAG: hypothetical protein M1827_003024 [Pycnora praestabilis]|nr:MAG: hypothetical protein M1827_003024 [Pycnora praestabilis]